MKDKLKNIIFDKFYSLSGEFNFNLDIFFNEKDKVFLKNISNNKKAEIKDKHIIGYNLYKDDDFINFITDFCNKYLN